MLAARGQGVGVVVGGSIETDWDLAPVSLGWCWRFSSMCRRDVAGEAAAFIEPPAMLG